LLHCRQSLMSPSQTDRGTTSARRPAVASAPSVFLP